MRTTSVVIALFLTAIPAAARQQAAPPRDPASQPQKGTASISGKVIAADTNRALRRARVTLTGIGLGADGRHTTSTALDGTYTFKDLPAARYRVSVERGGYLRLEYGQRRPGEAGRPIELAAGRTLKQIDFALPRMSAISGRVTDESGEPIEGVAVYAMRQLFYEGQRRLVPVSGTSVRTDDEGEYRIPRLAPGSYHVMASTKETWTVVEGGREVVLGYMPTYFPGTGTASDARRVTVGVGEHMRAVDFALVPGRTAKISGTAVDSLGRPFPRASLSEEVRGLNFASFGAGPAVTMGGDGAFTAVNVPPGEYMLQATRQAGPEGPPEVALLPIFVDGSGTDIEGLRLTGSSGGTVTGRFINEDGPLPKTSGLNVSLTEQFRGQPPPAVVGLFRGTGPVVAEDGTFTVNHVFGRSRFRVSVPDGWMVERIVQNGRDVMEKVFDLRSGEQIGGIEIHITDRVTELSGAVLDARNEPVMDATVLIFPEDADRWFETSAAMRALRPDQQGRWSHKGLPPGDYLAVALEYVDEVAWQDPDYLESLRRYCEKVTVAEGGSHALTLKLRTPKSPPVP